MEFLVVLVIMAMGGFLWGLMYASPLLLCGTGCFLFQRNVGLWCAWIVPFSIDLCLRITKIRIWIYNPYYYRPDIIGLAELFYIIIIVIVTVVWFGKEEYTVTRLRVGLFIAGVLFLFAAKILLIQLRY